ncbi:MAG TPA: hypothetical protein VLS93_06280 [Anaeromyxobacteraceae bacterium]|nr:hypothetical protein [Anaeromyxobacteraceae bacterium]
MRNGPFALAAAALLACAEAQPCPSPLEVCNGVCVDTGQDVDHCGACGSACGFGEFCQGGGCQPITQAPCDTRAGGAFVLLATCGQSVKAWISDPDFIAAATALVGSGLGAYPVLDVRDGTDCDGQWTWHVDPATARFAAAAQVNCAACPGGIEAAKAGWIGRAWCPGSGPDPVAFLLVESRP